MRKVCISAATMAFLLAVAGPSYAGGSRLVATKNYTNGTCHQKIDPKNLKGQPLKDAWKACRSDPDGYN